MTTPLNLPTPGAPKGTWAGPLNAAIGAVKDVADSAHVLSSETATGSFTVSAATSDVVEVDSATPVQVTFPAGLAGRAIEVFQQGAGQVEVIGGSGVAMTVQPPSTGRKTPGRKGSVQLRSRGGAAVTAPPTTNLALRLRASDVSGTDGSAVTSVSETSGQGHPAFACTDITLATNSFGSGQKGLVFNGSSSKMTMSGTALDVARNKGALTVFALVALTNPITTGVRTLFALSTGTSATASRVLLGHRESTAGLPIAGGRRLDANSLASTTSPTALTGTGLHIFAAHYRWSSSDVLLYEGGDLVGSNTSFQDNGSTSDTRSLAGSIGSNLAGNGEWFGGHLWELLAYWDADLTGDLRKTVDSYVLGAYDVPSSDGVTAEWVVAGGVA